MQRLVPCLCSPTSEFKGHSWSPFAGVILQLLGLNFQSYLPVLQPDVLATCTMMLHGWCRAALRDHVISGGFHSLVCQAFLLNLLGLRARIRINAHLRRMPSSMKFGTDMSELPRHTEMKTQFRELLVGVMPFLRSWLSLAPPLSLSLSLSLSL